MGSGGDRVEEREWMDVHVLGAAFPEGTVGKCA